MRARRTTRSKPACVRAARTPTGRARSPRNCSSELLQRKFLLYDKSGEEHYNLISALHKSVRNSDADASLYWLARMLESGEDPLYIARRLVRMASEDIGLAEPGALAVTIAAMQAADFVGAAGGQSGARAGGGLSVARAEIQRALHRLWRSGRAIWKTRARSRCRCICAMRVTGLMKNIGYGTGYQYAHDLEEKVADMACLPESLARQDLLITRRTRDLRRACGSAWKRFGG